MTWWDAQTPAAPAVPATAEAVAYWPEAARISKPHTPPPPAPAPKRKLGQIPAAAAWLVFRVAEAGDGIRDHVENLRVATDTRLNRLKPDDARDWDWDVPLLRHDQPDANLAWREFVRSWRWEPQELACAFEAASAIQGLEGLAWEAETYRDACNLPPRGASGEATGQAEAVGATDVAERGRKPSTASETARARTERNEANA